MSLKINRMMRNIFSFILVSSLFATFTFAQTEKKAVREGNREFKKSEYIDAEIAYRSALELNPSSYKANFNLGDALYKQEKYEEATQLYDDLKSHNIDSKDKAKVFHNLGNSYFKQQNFSESVEAYKNALRHNPNDIETKYNLAQAQRMLLQQEQQQDQNDEGDNQDDKQDNKDQKEQNKDEKQDDNKQDKEKQQDQQKQDQQEQEQKISPEDARRMLEAIQNTEQEIQDRVREEQAKQKQVRVDKNW